MVRLTRTLLVKRAAAMSEQQGLVRVLSDAAAPVDGKRRGVKKGKARGDDDDVMGVASATKGPWGA